MNSQGFELAEQLRDILSNRLVPDELQGRHDIVEHAIGGVKGHDFVDVKGLAVPELLRIEEPLLERGNFRRYIVIGHGHRPLPHYPFYSITIVCGPPEM